MSEDLGGRLLRAGVVDRNLLARARARAAARGLPLAVALADQGVSEAAIGELLVAEGFGPLLDAADLRGAEEPARRRLPLATMRSLFAVPVRSSPAGFVVAMADPSDPHAVADLRASLHADVLPTAVRIADLRAYLELVGPGDAAKKPKPAAPKPKSVPAPRDSDAPIELVRVRHHLEDDDVVVPLVRAKTGPKTPPRPNTTTTTTKAPEPTAPQVRREGAPRAGPSSVRADATATYELPPRKETLRPSFKAAPGVTAPARPRRRTPGFERSGFDDAPSAPISIRGQSTDPVPRAAASATELDPPAADRWGNLTGAKPVAPPPPSSIPPGEIGSLCAAMRAASDRAVVVQLACEGALTVGRASAFLAVKKAGLEIRHASALTTSLEKLRGTIVPLTGPSLLRTAIETGETYLGPHGGSGADKVFRDAIESIGGQLLIVPLVLAGKSIGVLCVDGLVYRARGRERVERLATTASEAFERIVRGSKR